MSWEAHKEKSHQVWIRVASGTGISWIPWIVLELFLKNEFFQVCSGIVLEFLISKFSSETDKDWNLNCWNNLYVDILFLTYLDIFIDIFSYDLFLKNVKMFLKCTWIVLELFWKFHWPPWWKFLICAWLFSFSQFLISKRS